jgi:hypothetical protein
MKSRTLLIGLLLGTMLTFNAGCENEALTTAAAQKSEEGLSEGVAISAAEDVESDADEESQDAITGELTLESLTISYTTTKTGPTGTSTYNHWATSPDNLATSAAFHFKFSPGISSTGFGEGPVNSPRRDCRTVKKQTCDDPHTVDDVKDWSIMVFGRGDGGCCGYKDAHIKGDRCVIRCAKTRVTVQGNRTIVVQPQTDAAWDEKSSYTLRIRHASKLAGPNKERLAKDKTVDFTTGE